MPGDLLFAVKILLRYGELGLKGRHVRGQMVRRLRASISRLFRDEGADAEVMEEEGRLFVLTDHPAAEELLGRVFGLVSFSPVEEAPSRMPEIVAKALELAERQQRPNSTFAVRTRRVGGHPYNSMDVAREVGAAVLSSFPALTVSLATPDWEILVEIRQEKAYLYTEVLPGVGGMPLGTQGKVVALVESAEGALASWLMMKRGCYVLPVFRRGDRWAQALRSWDPGLRWRRIASLAAMQDVAKTEGALGFVYPWGTGDVSEEDLRPAFYPLIGLDASQADGLRERVLGSLGP